jgi:hypothetical protein
VVFQERLSGDSERGPWPLIEEKEEEFEVRLAPVVVEGGREEGCEQETEEGPAEIEHGLEEMKWQVHWPQPGDEVGRRLMMIWQAAAGEIREAELAAQLGVTERSAREYVKTYRARGSSLAVIDGRHFNRGQQVDYRLEEHKAALVRQATLNLLQGESNSERGLAAQLAYPVCPRTVGRYLQETGWRGAEEAGLGEEVAAYLEKERQQAYWAGVAGHPLANVVEKIDPGEWQRAEPGVVGTSLGVAHLSLNGAYESLSRLVGGAKAGIDYGQRMGHTYLLYLLKSSGGRVSQAKHFVWEEVGGMLSGCGRASASGLRNWLVSTAEEAAEEVTVCRSDGGAEKVTRLEDYQMEGVAHRAQRGLIRGQAIYLDDYINAIYRQEPIAKSKHGVWNRIVKSFRRHIALDEETGHVVTCPLGRSDVTPLAVLQQVVSIIRGGLDRAGLGQELELVIVDRWWSVKPVIRWLWGEEKMKMLTWGKDIKSIREALAKVSEEELKKYPVTVKVTDEVTGQVEEKVAGYRLDTDLSIAELDQSVRGVVEWDGHPDSPKRVRLVVGLKPEEMETQAVVDRLRFRQRVEILLKQVQRRLNWSAFGGGKAKQRPAVPNIPDEEARQKVAQTRQRTATALSNHKAKLAQVEQEIAQLRQKKAPTNGLGLGLRHLKPVAKKLQQDIERATTRLAELDAWLQGAEQNLPPPPPEPVADLDLTREAIITQLKLDVFTAQETLVDDFIELALKPVLRQEAERQAATRQQLDLRSTAKGRQDLPLCTDPEKLYQIKLANLERETILNRLLNQPGHFVKHKTERIILSVANPFHDRRIQAAYEHYCVILNQRDIRVQMDGGEPWRLLFTYRLETPSSPAQFK